MAPELAEKIKLVERVALSLNRRLSDCDICPRTCRVNRLKKERGYCGTGKEMIVYNAFLHYGEEPGISGEKGSGTIFFSGCNLKCIYCQNYKFSHTPAGKKVSADSLAEIMIGLQKKGAHNINLVTPTHFLPQILNALACAFKNGLNIPIVYNTSGYEDPAIIRQLAGIIDIYLTDLKYLDRRLAERYSRAPNYPLFASQSLLEMNNQVKPLTRDKLLKKGVIIRHLILPGHILKSKKLLAWIKRSVPQALVSVMFQYQPYFKASLWPGINRPINFSEYLEIKGFTEKIGINGWVQDYQPKEDMAGPYFTPNI
jgi:putative pyruvate formate lyase activating enzyme